MLCSISHFYLSAYFPLLGLFWRQFMMEGADPEAWTYLSVALPASCLTGPLGALMISHCHRLVNATLCYILDTSALVSVKIPQV
jgi:Na+(H+)/acetate symporter ActP